MIFLAMISVTGSPRLARRNVSKVERSGEDADFVRSKCVIFQQGTDPHGNGSRLFAAFAGREPNGLPLHRLATEADDAGVIPFCRQ